MKGGLKICSHIHTESSMDCRMGPEEIVKKALSLGYDGLIITDHNTSKGGNEVLKIAKGRLEIIIGGEFSTEKGHILCINIDSSIEEDCLRDGDIYDFEDLRRRVRKIGGLIILAHPVKSSALYDMDFIRLIDGIELINSRVESSFAVGKSDDLLKEIMDKYDCPVLAGCDAHTLGEMGSSYMEFIRGSWPQGKDELREVLLGEKYIYYKKTSYKLIAYNKLTENKNGDFKFYIKQLVKIILGIFIDFKNGLRGNKFEIIQIGKKNK